jgi:hypothetical protein
MVRKRVGSRTNYRLGDRRLPSAGLIALDPAPERDPLDGAARPECDRSLGVVTSPNKERKV